MDQPTNGRQSRNKKRASRDALSPEARGVFDAPSARLSSSSCVPAELDSVSPSKSKPFEFDREQQPFEHPSHASKESRGFGAGPHHKKENERQRDPCSLINETFF